MRSYFLVSFRFNDVLKLVCWKLVLVAFFIERSLECIFHLRSKILLLQFFLITINWHDDPLTWVQAIPIIFGIICDPIWESFMVEDHLWSILGISCGWGSSYCTELSQNLCHFLPYLENRIHHYTGLFSQVNLPLCSMQA